MKSRIDYKKTGRIVGFLYIAGTITGVLSVPLLNKRTAPDFFTEIAMSKSSFILGALLVLAMGFSLAFIPALMFPILKKHSEPLGVGYIIFRGALETCTVIIRFICFLSLASLSTDYIAGAQTATSLLSLGALMNSILKMPMAEFAFGCGALVFYYALLKYKLVPRWIPALGVIAIVLHIASAILVLLGLQEHFDTGSLIMNLPIAIQEMVMAIWFIVNGFHGEEAKRDVSLV
ncbi:MAG: DUF4386 domain-containing protein [Oscillospiraceae bacterium]|nr:DUF4386 domain-containing protein [Oscillospiraceae bacterium]